MTRTTPPSWPLLYGAVALTSLATLLLELSLTRIFSVIFYYHFAFLAISIALFGLGLGGVFSYLVSNWRGSLFAKLGNLSALNALLVTVAVLAALNLKDTSGAGRLALIYFTSALPFICSGTILSLAISESIERVDRVYFFDLLGAAAGCLALVPLLTTFGGPNTTLCTAALFATAAAIWFSLAASTPGRLISVALGLVFALLIGLNYRYNFIDVHYAKGHELRNEEFVRWNSFSRIALGREKESNLPMIFIDADASTGIARFDFENLSSAERHTLLYEGPGLPYDVRPGAKTLIIGPGGGWDVSRALASGSRDVTGVEINPIIATTIMRKLYPERSRSLYARPEVHIFVEDGRAFIRRSPDRFQIIQATLVDTWASTAAGAFALSENNLYTSEAFRDYLSHLTPDGILAVTRWGFEPPRESLRLLSLGMAALKDLGENDPAGHFIVARAGSAANGWGAQDTVLISRHRFSPQDISRARAAMAEGNLTPVYFPDAGVSNPFADLLTSPDPRAFEKSYRYNIAPVTDNRPFFFYTVQPRDLVAFVTGASRDTADYKVNAAVPLLFESLLISLAAVALMLTLPPLVLGTRLPREGSVMRFLFFFVCIGVGYILIEVALIQKFVLFLGHPTYALTVVIFALLLSSGFGSYFSRRVIRGGRDRLLRVMLVLAFVVGLLALVVTAALPAAVGLPVAAKIVISAILIFPAGFLMGIPFPSGLDILQGLHPPSIRWAWSLNAASSVLGSVAALVCAIYLGLMQALLLGASFYVCAWVILIASRRRAESKPAAVLAT